MADDPNTPTPPPTPTAAPSIGVVVKAYVAVLVCAVIAAVLVLNDCIVDITVTVNTSDFQWFAILYVAAQAIERLLEPIMGKVKAVEVAKAKKDVASARVTATDASTQQTELAQVQADRAVIAWGIASSIALVLCGFLNLGIIDSLATVDVAKGFSADAYAVINVVITGLVIGAGTKPLHDLITRIEKAKDKADPQTGT